MAFGEDGCHALLVILPCQHSSAFLPLESGRVGHCLVALIRQMSAEKFVEQMTGRSLQPDVKKVRQFSVHHIVVVRRVYDDSVDAGVFYMVEAVAGLACDVDGRANKPVSFRLIEHFVLGAVDVGTEQHRPVRPYTWQFA